MTKNNPKRLYFLAGELLEVAMDDQSGVTPIDKLKLLKAADELLQMAEESEADEPTDEWIQEFGKTAIKYGIKAAYDWFMNGNG